MLEVQTVCIPVWSCCRSHTLSKRRIVPLPIWKANPETDPEALFQKDAVRYTSNDSIVKTFCIELGIQISAIVPWSFFRLLRPLRGDKVSVLTHTYEHNPPWGILKWPYAITRLTAHFMWPDVRSGDLQVQKKYGHTWHRMSLLRPGVIKQHKPSGCYVGCGHAQMAAFESLNRNNDFPRGQCHVQCQSFSSECV